MSSDSPADQPINQPQQNSHANYVSSNTVIPVIYLDKVELRVYLRCAPQAYPMRVALPKHLGNFFHRTYLDRAKSGNINIGKGWKEAKTNGRLIYLASENLPLPSRRGARDIHANELLPSEKDALLQKTQGQQPWEYQIGLLANQFPHILSFAKESFGADTFVKLVSLKHVEFYAEFPLTPNPETSFEAVTRIIAQNLNEPTEVKRNKTKNRLEAAFELSEGAALCKCLRLKYYLKKNVFRLELQFSGVKFPNSRDFSSLVQSAHQLYDCGIKILTPIHDGIVANSVAPTGNVSDLWCRLDKFHFRKARRLDDFKLLVERLSQYGTYTPTYFPKELRLSRWTLSRLIEPQNGILTKVQLANKLSSYRLRPDWNLVPSFKTPSTASSVDLAKTSGSSPPISNSKIQDESES